MTPFDQLELVAEIAAALLGFFAIFQALSTREGRFTESDRHFVQALVMSSSIAIIVAMTPRVISLFGTIESIWQIATAVALTLGSVAIVMQARQQLRMTREEAAQIHWLWHVGAWVLAIVAAVFFTLGLFNAEQITAYYVSGASLLIPLCLWVFIGVVFRRFF